MKSQNFDMPFSENRKLRPRAARSGAPNKIYALEIHAEGLPGNIYTDNIYE